jgi:hypothetical protein
MASAVPFSCWSGSCRLRIDQIDPATNSVSASASSGFWNRRDQLRHASRTGSLGKTVSIAAQSRTA